MEGLKTGYENAIKANGGKWPSTEQVAEAMRKMEFKAYGRTVSMREDGQGLEDQMLGVTKMTAAYPFPVIQGLTVYPGSLVTNPIGTKSPEWVKTLKIDMLKDTRIKSF